MRWVHGHQTGRPRRGLCDDGTSRCGRMRLLRTGHISRAAPPATSIDRACRRSSAPSSQRGQRRGAAGGNLAAGRRQRQFAAAAQPAVAEPAQRASGGPAAVPAGVVVPKSGISAKQAAQVQRAMGNMSRASAIMRTQLAGQAAARAMAVALNPTIPNGLVIGGLDPSDPASWINASLGTPASRNGTEEVTVDQSASKAILTWKTFNIGADTTLTFDQKGQPRLGRAQPRREQSQAVLHPRQDQRRGLRLYHQPQRHRFRRHLAGEPRRPGRVVARHRPALSEPPSNATPISSAPSTPAPPTAPCPSASI